MRKPSLHIIKAAITTIGRGLRWLVLALCLLWSIGLYIYQPITLLSLIAIPLVLLVMRCLPTPAGKGYLLQLIARAPKEAYLWSLFLLSVISYLSLPGPQPEKWQSPWAHAPQFSLEGDTLTIRNLRDFHYRSELDYDPIWRTETYNLSTITGADFAECHWDGMEAICHTMMSFSFADGKHLVVSAETRLPEGEAQSALGGLYKRYGLLYIFGTEADIFGLRTNHRHEDLLLLPMKVKPQGARAMLMHFVHLAQAAEKNHTAYNTAANNCSSGVMATFRHLAPDMPLWYDLAPIHNGSISRILFNHGALITRPGETYDALRKRCYLRYDISPDAPEQYSSAIRKHIQQL